MPPEADDKGLAMTGSFTTMLLAGLLITKIYKNKIWRNSLIYFTDMAIKSLMNMQEILNK